MEGSLRDLGRFSEPALLVLTSLAARGDVPRLHALGGRRDGTQRPDQLQAQAHGHHDGEQEHDQDHAAAHRLAQRVAGDDDGAAHAAPTASR